MAVQAHILEAASALLEEVGTEGMSTQAVCRAAGVDEAMLLRHVGDGDALLQQLVMRGVAKFMKMKREEVPIADPLADMRRGWDAWLEFALARPRVFALMAEYARRGPSESDETFAILRGKVTRLHAEGRLRLDVDSAAQTVWIASDRILTQFLQGASADQLRAANARMFETVMAAILV